MSPRELQLCFPFAAVDFVLEYFDDPPPRKPGRKTITASERRTVEATTRRVERRLQTLVMPELDELRTELRILHIEIDTVYKELRVQRRHDDTDADWWKGGDDPDDVDPDEIPF